MYLWRAQSRSYHRRTRRKGFMELTVTPNGAIYAVQHASGEPPRTRNNRAVREDPAGDLRTVRTSVGQFAMRSSQVGCYLELIVGQVHRVLGLYKTSEAAREALLNRQTGFSTWDSLDAVKARAQLSALEHAS